MGFDLGMRWGCCVLVTMSSLGWLGVRSGIETGEAKDSQLLGAAADLGMVYAVPKGARSSGVVEGERWGEPISSAGSDLWSAGRCRWAGLHGGAGVAGAGDPDEWDLTRLCRLQL